MLLGYVYKLRPDKAQSDIMDSWLDMLRASYNYNLRERIDGYDSRFIQGEYCDLKTKAEICPLTCYVGDVDGYPWKVSGGQKTKKQLECGIFGDYCDIDTRLVYKAASVKPALRNVGEIQMSELQSKKAGLNRAISDAGWYELRTKIEYAAAKSGKIFGVVPPHHTSQECVQCHHVDASNRDGEKFLCTECGYSADADQNGGVNIKNRGVEKFGIALKCRVKVKKIRVDCSESKQLMLFETPSPELTGFYGQNDGSTRQRRKRQQPGNLPIQQSLDLWNIKDLA